MNFTFGVAGTERWPGRAQRLEDAGGPEGRRARAAAVQALLRDRERVLVLPHPAAGPQGPRDGRAPPGPPYSRAPSNKRFADALAKVDNTPKPFEEEMSTCEEEAFWLIREAIHSCIKLYDRASGGLYPVEKDYLEGFLESSLPMKEDERLLMNTKLNYIKTIAGNGNGPIQRATRPRRDLDSNSVYIGVLRGWLEHFEDVAQFRRQTKGRRHRFS